MNNENLNWHFVQDSDGRNEDIIRFDLDDKTFCIYKLQDGFYATDGYVL